MKNRNILKFVGFLILAIFIMAKESHAQNIDVSFIATNTNLVTPDGELALKKQPPIYLDKSNSRIIFTKKITSGTSVENYLFATISMTYPNGTDNETRVRNNGKLYVKCYNSQGFDLCDEMPLVPQWSAKSCISTYCSVPFTGRKNFSYPTEDVAQLARAVIYFDLAPLTDQPDKICNYSNNVYFNITPAAGSDVCGEIEPACMGGVCVNQFNYFQANVPSSIKNTTDCRQTAGLCATGYSCDQNTGDCFVEDCTKDGCSAGKVCDTSTKQCRSFDCSSTDSCSNGQVCDSYSKQCRSFDCTWLDQCSSGNTCDTTTKQCVPDCTVTGCTGGKLCDTGIKQCVADVGDCTKNPCPSGSTCDLDTKSCSGFDCTRDGCAGSTVCDSTSRQCVSNVTPYCGGNDRPCPLGYYCDKDANSCSPYPMLSCDSVECPANSGTSANCNLNFISSFKNLTNVRFDCSSSSGGVSNLVTPTSYTKDNLTKNPIPFQLSGMTDDATVTCKISYNGYDEICQTAVVNVEVPPASCTVKCSENGILRAGDDANCMMEFQPESGLSTDYKAACNVIAYNASNTQISSVSKGGINLTSIPLQDVVNNTAVQCTLTSKDQTATCSDSIQPLSCLTARDCNDGKECTTDECVIGTRKTQWRYIATCQNAETDVDADGALDCQDTCKGVANSGAGQTTDLDKDGTPDACDACVAVAETCDGKDNDCDGQVDNGVTNACGTCGVAPVEVCDGADNDCDKQIDEGVKNACGACGEVPPETCDGQDNDCDGQVDDGVKNACGTCGVVTEVCGNKKDDDCDKQVDEDCQVDCGNDSDGDGRYVSSAEDNTEDQAIPSDAAPSAPVAATPDQTAIASPDLSALSKDAVAKYLDKLAYDQMIIDDGKVTLITSDKLGASNTELPVAEPATPDSPVADQCPVDHCPNTPADVLAAHQKAEKLGLIVRNGYDYDTDGDGTFDSCEDLPCKVLCFDADGDGVGSPNAQFEPVIYCGSATSEDDENIPTATVIWTPEDTKRLADRYSFFGQQGQIFSVDSQLTATPEASSVKALTVPSAASPYITKRWTPGYVASCNDNCPVVPNQDQKNEKSPDLGVGDACEVPCPTCCCVGEGCPEADCKTDPANDPDGDGWNNAIAACDNCSTANNPDQRDSDLDGIGDSCDNCPDARNADQKDSNSNGKGDACENAAPVPVTPTDSPKEEDGTPSITPDQCLAKEGFEVELTNQVKFDLSEIPKMNKGEAILDVNGNEIVVDPKTHEIKGLCKKLAWGLRASGSSCSLTPSAPTVSRTEIAGLFGLMIISLYAVRRRTYALERQSKK